MPVFSGLQKGLLLAAFAALAGLATSLLMSQPKPLVLASGTLLKTPRDLPAFTLSGAAGQPLTRADFAGHWTVVFAGFTFCPDVCPTTLTELKAVRSQLSPATRDQLAMMFLSVDPARDSPEKIAKYLAYFDRAFIGATAAEDQLQTLGAAMGFVYAKVPGTTPSTYTLDHSTALILIDPQARVAGYLTPPFRPAQMAADLDAIVARTRLDP